MMRVRTFQKGDLLPVSDHPEAHRIQVTVGGLTVELWETADGLAINGHRFDVRPIASNMVELIDQERNQT